MAVDADAASRDDRLPQSCQTCGLRNRTGKREASLETCRDADDVFVDARRRRVYVSCGEGVIDVFAQAGGGYERIARIPTVAGARTSLFVPGERPALSRRAGDRAEPAAIWVFRPHP